MNRDVGPDVAPSMTDMLNYSQRIQLALLVLFASLCLNLGSLLGHPRSPQQQAAVTRQLPGG